MSTEGTENVETRVKRLREELGELESALKEVESEQERYKKRYFELHDEIMDVKCVLGDLERQQKYRVRERHAVERLQTVYAGAKYAKVRDALVEKGFAFGATVMDSGLYRCPDEYSLVWKAAEDRFVRVAVSFNKIAARHFDCTMSVECSRSGLSLPLYHLSSAGQVIWARVVEAVGFPALLSTTVRLSELVVELITDAEPAWGVLCNFDCSTYAGEDGTRYYCVGGGMLPVLIPSVDDSADEPEKQQE